MRNSAWRRGTIVVLAAFLMVVFLMFAAFAVDVGFLMLQRTRAQAAADAASLAGVTEIGGGMDRIEETVDKMLVANGFDLTANNDLQRTISMGFWDQETRLFSPVNKESEANAVRVGLLHNQTKSFFGRVFGTSSHRIPAQAIAIRGVPARDVVLVIDVSTSMGRTMSNGEMRVDNAKAAAQDLVQQLGDRDRVGLAVYSWYDPQRKNYDRTGVIERFLDLDKQPTFSRIGQLTKGEYAGGTNIGGGFRAGLDVFLTSPRRTDLPAGEQADRVLVMLTDGRVNKAEPYPEPDDGKTGQLPPPPYKKDYDKRESVRQWANAIRARGILVHVITLGASAHDELMVNAASVSKNGTPYYHHISEGPDDVQQLLKIYRNIGRGPVQPRLAD